MQAVFSRVEIPDTARRLSACVIGLEQTSHLAHEAVVSMEMHLLSRGWPVGEPLGALSDVQKALGIGRPAYREAITIMEARGLLNIRRGPGGGLFVFAPTAEDVVGATVMYLALTGAKRGCVREFRLLVWRMVVEAAIGRGVRALAVPAEPSGWGFAFELAEQLGNSAMRLAARLAEMLVRVYEGCPAPASDDLLEDAFRKADLAAAFGRLDALAGTAELAVPIRALDAVERGLCRSGRKSAMALAARMARELSDSPETLEAERETADRLGYTDAVVRQARRILQDFGVLSCRQGRKGAVWAPPTSPAGVIRLLAPHLVASGVSEQDNQEAASFLASSAPRLAAERAERVGAPIRVLAPCAQGDHLMEVFRTENLLLELAGNPLLTIMVRSLGLANILTNEIRPALSEPDMINFNRRILQAIEAGDAESAGAFATAKAHAMGRSVQYRKAA